MLKFGDKSKWKSHMVLDPNSVTEFYENVQSLLNWILFMNQAISVVV